jgi:VIT1/CCC1 family predicted Fe2+/Mn2+ transporter
MRGASAARVSHTLAILAHLGVGAARSVFIRRGIIRSGMDTFVVGLGVAVVGYFIGERVGRFL